MPYVCRAAIPGGYPHHSGFKRIRLMTRFVASEQRRYTSLPACSKFHRCQIAAFCTFNGVNDEDTRDVSGAYARGSCMRQTSTRETSRSEEYTSELQSRQ